MKKPYSLISDDKFTMNKSIVFNFNNAPIKVKDLTIGEDIIIDGKLYIIQGIESWAIAEPHRGELTQFGILV